MTTILNPSGAGSFALSVTPGALTGDQAYRGAQELVVLPEALLEEPRVFRCEVASADEEDDRGRFGSRLDCVEDPRPPPCSHRGWMGFLPCDYLSVELGRRYPGAPSFEYLLEGG